MNDIGRPSAYIARHAEQAYKLCLLGATDAELADFFGVAPATIYNCKNEHVDFFLAAVRCGKIEADANIAEKLYHRALGYSHPAVKIFMPQGASAPVYAEYVEHHPPDTKAASLLLRNRQPAKWRDKTETKNRTTLTTTDSVAALLERVASQGRFMILNLDTSGRRTSAGLERP